MGWHGLLRIDYRHEDGRTVALDRHHGPMRVLQRLYPEGDAICHHVLVHPPGGLAGGDRLDIELNLTAGSHAVVTTPGAARYYRSLGEAAVQQVKLRVDAGARLEWLPLEAIAYDGCEAENRLQFDLQGDAAMIGWDMLALGLPASELPYARGRVLQHLEMPGVWLERGQIAASDTVLRDGATGLAGHGVLGTLWCAAGAAMPGALRESLLEAAREVMAAHALAPTAGATSPDAQVVVCRALAQRVEPLFGLWQQIRGRWRTLMWQLGAQPPRIWRT